MKIGMTYDLRDDYLAQGLSQEETAEFDAVETIEAIESALKDLGFIPERIGQVKQLVAALANGKRWDLVFNIAEGLFGSGREAQVPALLDAYNIPYTFSDTVTLACAHDKSIAKRIVRDHNIPTAPFMVVRTLEDIHDWQLPFPVFAKPNAEGTSKGITATSRIESKEALSTVCSELLHRFQQPVLVESFLPGREFTVGLLGTGSKTQILGVMEVLLLDNAEQSAYSFANKEHYEERVDYRLVDDVQAHQAGQVALAAWKALGCRDAGRIDIRSNAQEVPHFLEVNPIAGLHPVRSDLVIMAKRCGMTYKDLISRIMTEALQRNNLELPIETSRI